MFIFVAKIRRKRKKETSKDLKEQDGGLTQSTMNDYFQKKKKTTNANVKN